jgi:hypothetical protein
MERWTARLKQGGYVPARETSLYRDISTTLAFDYLIGNWDRWSGGNAQGVPSGERLFIRDHNAAFTPLFGLDRYARLAGFLERSEKFSRALVERLGDLDESALRRELIGDGGPLPLNEEQIQGVVDRRRELLSYFTMLVEQYGAERVLVFP